MVADDGDADVQRGALADVARRRPVSTFVSLYAPSGRRRWWWYSYRCARCSTYQLGRARDLAGVTGQRRAGCGHMVEIVVARIYGSPEAAA
jgi:hypothetical protein